MSMAEQPGAPEKHNYVTDGHASLSNSVETSSGRDDMIIYNPKEDRLLTTKLDFKVIPILSLLYLICFLDRTNIANARIAGMEKGLDMPKHGFNTALWIFYIPFVLAEIPLNMMLSRSRIKPNIFLGVQTLLLGIFAMCQGLTKSYSGLLGIRFLMGVVETGLPAGATLIITSYYRKKELSLRFSLFMSAGVLGACFSGLLAYAIADINGAGGYAGWRWIFIIEGLITIFFSIFVFAFTPGFPSTDSRLSEKDRNMLLLRMEADRGEEENTQAKVKWTKIFLDYKIWLLTLMFFCADMSAGSLSSFNPTITSQLGWTSRRAQVMTIPIWVVGIVGGLSASFASGRLNKRWPLILPAICCSVAGWAIHYRQVQPAGVRYFAQFLISFGTFVQMPIYIGMLTANLRGRAAQSIGTAISFGLGNCANFVSSNVFISTQAPKYPVGFATGLAITALAFPLTLLAMFLFTMHNKNIEKKRMALGPGEELDDQVDYKYVF